MTILAIVRRTLRPLLALIAVLGIVGASCSAERTTSSTAVAGEITVFAAASLTAAFTDIGAAFMARHPDADVTFNFAASSELVTQIGQGAPADVFASADQSNMKKLVDAGNNRTDPVVFAENSLAIIVEPGNPRGVTDVADLADPDLTVVTCAPEVPCGKYAAQVFAAAGVTVTPKSLEKDVKAVVTKVILGEADAGVVYATDVAAAGARASGVSIPTASNVIAQYPVVVTKEALNTTGAQAFIDFVRGADGQEILASYGFLGP